MKSRTLLVVATLFGLCPPALANDTPLRIYLPRTADVKGPIVRLGALGIVRGEDAKLRLKAADVALGRAPWAKEHILIDRRTVMSQLAARGIPAELVQLLGAKEVVVGRHEKIVKTAELLKVAETFLNKRCRGRREGSPDASSGDADPVDGWRLVRRPADLVIPDAGDIKLLPRLTKKAPRGYVKLEIVAISGERELAVSEVLYEPIYAHRQAVATKTMPPGEAISKENTKIETVTSRRPQNKGFSAPYGMIAARLIESGAVLRPGMIAPAQLEIVIRRNQPVVMQVRGPGFVVTAKGEALGPGRPGDFIKVRNVDSKRIVVAKVAFDGTVEPVARGR